MGFTDSFNSALRGGSMLQGILYNQEQRNLNKAMKRADEFGRGLIALENQYGSKNPRDWGAEGQQLLNDHMNSYSDVSGVGDRPNGQAEFNAIVPAGDGVAAVVTVPDGKGGSSTGPLTRDGSTEDDDPVSIVTSTDQLIKPVADNMRYLTARFNARVNSTKTHEALTELDNQQNTESSLEVLNERFSGGTPGVPTEVSTPAPEGAVEPTIGSAPSSPAAVTSPGPQPPSAPAAATGQVVSFTPEIDSSIAKHAEGHGLDPRVVQALVQTESGGNPDAYNGKAGATGLMQMTPIGLKEFNIQYGKDYTMEDMKDPEKNLEAGTGLLKYYTDKQGGDIQQGLAAFNGGITRLRKNKGDITKMPPETRDYVEKINAITESSPPGAGDQGPGTQDQVAPRSRGRGRNKNTATPLDQIDAEIAAAEKHRDRMTATQKKRGRGGVSGRKGAEQKIANLKAEREEIIAQQNAGANEAAEEARLTQEGLAHEAELNKMADAFSPRNAGQEKVIKELKESKGPATEEEATAAVATIAATKPAKKWSDKERKALYTLHRLNPNQFPLKDVVTALETGRMTKSKWTTVKNAADQLVQYDDNGNMRVLPETAEAIQIRNNTMAKSANDAAISRVQKAQQVKSNQLSQNKAELDFAKDQSRSVWDKDGADDNAKWEEYRDKVVTTNAAWGMDMTSKEGVTMSTKANRLGDNWKKSKEFALFSPSTWFSDEPILSSLEPGVLTLKAPGNPHNFNDPDPDVQAEAVDWTMKTFVQPLQAAGLDANVASNGGLVAIEMINRGYATNTEDAMRVVTAAAQKNPGVFQDPAKALKMVEDYVKLQQPQ